MKNLMNGFLLALCAGMASPAVAQNAPAPSRPAAAVAAPVNQDEFVSRRLAHLRQADANADGQVTPEEMAASRRARVEAMRSQRLEAGFARLDTNSDGVLSRDEFVNRPKTPHEGARSRPAMRGHMARHNARRSAVAPQVVNIAQAEQKARENFAAMDTNNDGVLTAQERREHRRAMFETRREQRMQRRGAAASPSAPVSE